MLFGVYNIQMIPNENRCDIFFARSKPILSTLHTNSLCWTQVINTNSPYLNFIYKIIHKIMNKNIKMCTL